MKKKFFTNLWLTFHSWSPLCLLRSAHLGISSFYLDVRASPYTYRALHNPACEQSVCVILDPCYFLLAVLISVSLRSTLMSGLCPTRIVSYVIPLASSRFALSTIPAAFFWHCSCLRLLYLIRMTATSEVFLNKIPGRCRRSSGVSSIFPIFNIGNRYIYFLSAGLLPSVRFSSIDTYSPF